MTLDRFALAVVTMALTAFALSAGLLGPNDADHLRRDRTLHDFFQRGLLGLVQITLRGLF